VSCTRTRNLTQAILELKRHRAVQGESVQGESQSWTKVLQFVVWRRHVLGDRDPSPAVGSDRKSCTPRSSSSIYSVLLCSNTDQPRAPSAIFCCTARPLSTSHVLEPPMVGLRSDLPGSAFHFQCSRILRVTLASNPSHHQSPRNDRTKPIAAAAANYGFGHVRRPEVAARNGRRTVNTMVPFHRCASNFIDGLLF
jgi:hypothetical protein